ncbi:unnamed protein product [Peronospora belbahrii]|uniref:Uncharacterized protein n=1 Tax=Peronospora belbahrii TaxID=622444 RepID=A0AAU9KYE0_9STRA|nr:unnamed protein product [Peronospora belbahrii]CAH0519451.1 unnamed protein product [Peronospora belbahrii]
MTNHKDCSGFGISKAEWNVATDRSCSTTIGRQLMRVISFDICSAFEIALEYDGFNAQHCTGLITTTPLGWQTLFPPLAGGFVCRSEDDILVRSISCFRYEKARFLHPTLRPLYFNS